MSPLLLLLLALVVVLAVVLVLVLGGGGTKKAATGEVQLESAASMGDNPFTASVASSPPPTINAASPSFPPVPTPTTTPAPIILRPARGDTVGLYGGTGQISQCDAGQMAAFLGQNPSKAAAWVAALNSDPTLRWSGGTTVSTSQIPQYLAQLTPVILRSDTRVTNNGFLNGNATPHQSILQAGTAVLVDTYGVPRSRCACGNPLLPPHSVTGTVTYGGTPWAGFSPTTVVVVNPSPTVINSFTLVNITNNTTYTVPAGQPPTQPTTAPSTAPGQTSTVTVTAQPTPGSTAPPTTTQPTSQPTAGPTSRLSVPPSLTLGTGDVQITLLWTGDSDLDLHAIDPANQEIWFSNPMSNSGGKLDHDEIPGCGTPPATHVENIFWPPGGAPSGNYQAFVVNFTACPGKPAPSYELRITVNGRVIYDTTSTIAPVSGTKSTPVPFSK